MSGLVVAGPRLWSGKHLAKEFEVRQREVFDGKDVDVVTILSTGETALKTNVDPASDAYTGRIVSYGHRIGVASTRMFAEEVAIPQLLQGVAPVDGRTRGVVVAFPLHRSEREWGVRSAIPLNSDIDAKHPATGFPQPTPEAMWRAALDMGIDKVDLGRSTIAVLGAAGKVGGGLTSLLRRQGAGLDNIIQIDRKFGNERHLPDAVQESDIVFTALTEVAVTSEMLTGPREKKVIDAGIISTDNGLIGNVDPKVYDSSVSAHISMVPGGVGVLTLPMLYTNLETATIR